MKAMVKHERDEAHVVPSREVSLEDVLQTIAQQI